MNERALDLANETVEKVALKSRRQKELELKEDSMDYLIGEIAKNLIKENEEYISKEIADKSIEEIENSQKDKENKKKRTKKGA